jgi:acyl carrier protein phosphodiesterase
MSTTSKRITYCSSRNFDENKEFVTPINESASNILSIDHDDDNENYDGFVKHLEEDTHRKKNRIAFEIEELGNNFIGEIERKNKLKKEKSNKLIPFILKYCSDKYSEKELEEYSYEDVKDIYDDLKNEHQSFFSKLINFIFFKN